MDTNGEPDQHIWCSNKAMVWMVRLSKSGKEKRFVSSPKSPDRTAAHSPSYSTGNWVLSLELCDRGMKLTTHLHLVYRLRKNERLYLYSSTFLHGVDRENPSFTFYGFKPQISEYFNSEYN